MGDRAQVKIVDEYHPERAVFLYTHWGGHGLAAKVHRALSKGWRWTDGCYLARCVFNEMQGDDRGETGFGIDTAQHGDIEHPLVVLKPGNAPTIEIGEWSSSFEAFVADPLQGFAAYGLDE